MVALQTLGTGIASYAGGQLARAGTYYVSKEVLEQTSAQAENNAGIAEFVGTIATGIAVAKPINQAVKNRFSLNEQVASMHLVEEKNVRRTSEVEITFNYSEKIDTEEFIRQLSNQEKSMNKLTLKEYILNRSRYVRVGRSTVSQKLQKEIREMAILDKIDELIDEGYSLSEASHEANEWIKTKHVLHDPDQVAGGYAIDVSGLGDAIVNKSIGSQWKSRIYLVDNMVDEFIKTIPAEDIDRIYLNIKLVPEFKMGH